MKELIKLKEQQAIHPKINGLAYWSDGEIEEINDEHRMMALWTLWANYGKGGKDTEEDYIIFQMLPPEPKFKPGQIVNSNYGEAWDVTCKIYDWFIAEGHFWYMTSKGNFPEHRLTA